MEPARVLLADDHPGFRGLLRALVDSSPDLELVGEAADGIEAIELARELQPDVVVMDISMPGVSGIEATREIVARSPRIGILVITIADGESVDAAMRAGARGWLLKGSPAEEVVRAIQAVVRGEHPPKPFPD
jgi:DNA-binding NarL/FixJ family response regulator